MENVLVATFGLLFIFVMTSCGALTACFIPEKKFGTWFPFLGGFSAGIMVAASVWSLILPALETAGDYAALKVGAGVALGGAFIYVFGLLFPEDESAGFNKLFVAMTAHNIPEGLAVGFALGAGIAGGGGAMVGLPAAIGIGLQNFPEGAAITLPARKIYSRKKAFLKGVISGAVEPISGAVGVLTVGLISSVMPYLTAFSAGAMLFVVFSEFTAKTETDGAKNAIGALVGFILMMAADVLLSA